MVATPSAAYATGTWEATYARASIGSRVIDMVAQRHPLVRFLFNSELDSMRAFTATYGKPAKIANGYTPQRITLGSLSAIERHIKATTMATTGAIAMSAAQTTSADPAGATPPTRILTSDYGTLYGVTTWGLPQEVRGTKGGENIRDWNKDVILDIGQQLSALLNTGLYSDGTTNQIDGLAYWRATTGTKWNSSNIATTDTFLQGLSATDSEAAFTLDKFREWVDASELGEISATRSEGLTPNIFMCSSAVLRKLKKWVDEKQTIELQQGKGNKFVELGTPMNYVMIDGVCCFRDPHLDTLLSTNWGIGYFMNADYMELILHPKYNFRGIDANTYDGETPEDLKTYDLPSYIFKKGKKAIILCNFYYARPRNLLYAVIT